MNQLPQPPLLIGIGNRLRSDDGIGYRIAEILRAERAPLQVLAVQQLTPELAEPIASASAVLFVDASVRDIGADPLRLEPLLPPDSLTDAAAVRAPLSHQCSPTGLLQLSQKLYGRWPPAWQLLIPAQQLQLGEDLSPTAATAMAQALTLLRQWRPGHA
jgi:hydrogenase maturation protease